jgi:glycosyltransferase involved in cell wall biosynthesis
MKPIILTFTSFYLPGYRGGGPIRSIANMVDKLSDDYEFLIVTTDRDLEDSSSYQNVTVDDWNQVGKAKVFYASSSARSIFGVKQLLRNTTYDILYLNSFFDAEFTVVPLVVRWMGFASRVPTIIAPRGEFSEGAFKLKRLKKATFTKLAIWIGLYDGVVWHASTDFEKTDIFRKLGKKNTNIFLASNLIVAPDLLSNYVESDVGNTYGNPRCKEYLDVCFLSRLSPKKNLDFALRILARVSVAVHFTIYGPQEDPIYWDMCQKLIKQLPDNIMLNYEGAIAHEHVVTTLAKHDLFFLPTHGENFGHVFIEAWAAGLLVLASDQTPWRSLERQRLGWDISLDSQDEFVRVLELVAKFDAEQWQQAKLRCRQFSHEKSLSADALNLNRRLFAKALEL